MTPKATSQATDQPRPKAGTPPQHPDRTVHPTKSDAEAAERGESKAPAPMCATEAP